MQHGSQEYVGHVPFVAFQVGVHPFHEALDISELMSTPDYFEPSTISIGGSQQKINVFKTAGYIYIYTYININTNLSIYIYDYIRI